MKRWGWHPPAMLALLAVLLILGAWAGLGMWKGYRLLSVPFALPGARSLPGAVVFNVLVFVLPGGLMAVLADGLRQRLPPELVAGWQSWWPRIGCGLALLAALAWIAQGLFSLDTITLPGHADSGSTFLLIDPNIGSSRWHISAWMLWQFAVSSAAFFMAAVVPGLRMYGAAILVVFIVQMVLPREGMEALVQPLQVLLWGVWMWAGLKVFTRPAVTWLH